MCLLSVPLHVLFHPPGLLFLPYSSNFALLTPKESSLLQRGLPELLAQVSTPRFPVCNAPHASRYLLNVCSHKYLAPWGAGTVTMLFPGMVSVAHALHCAWPI